VYVPDKDTAVLFPSSRYGFSFGSNYSFTFRESYRLVVVAEP